MDIGVSMDMYRRQSLDGNPIELYIIADFSVK